MARRRVRRRGLSRREFLVGTTAAGVAAGMPAWLLGCGDDDKRPAAATPTATATTTATATATPVPRPREARTLHFDFSFAAVTDPVLVALTGASDRAPLLVHTAESRALHRETNPLLRAVPDERLTHYLGEVDLPSDSFQLLWVTGTHGASGDPALLALFVHIPAAWLLAAAERRAATGTLRPPAKLEAYGIATTGGLLDLYPAVNEFVTPWDTAAALVFHHPEVTNLDPDQGTDILDLIQTLPCAPSDPNCTPALGSLAFRIAEQWPATTSGGWATLVPFHDVDGTPVLDDDGNPVYTYQLDESVIVPTVMNTARTVLAEIFDDPRFVGNNWHDLQGMTVMEPQGVGAVAQGSGLAVTAELPPGTTTHGLEWVDVHVVDPSTRTVEIALRNHYLRSVSVYVRYANEAGDLPIDTPGERDTSRSKEVGVVITNCSLLGIPLMGDLILKQRLRVDVPAEASKVRFYFGSLGTGGDAFCPEAVIGSALTIVFNIGLPFLFMAAGAIADASAGISNGILGLLFNVQPGFYNPSLNGAIFAALRSTVLQAPGGITRGIFGSATSKSAQPILVGLGDSFLQALLRASPLIVGKIAVQISKGALTTSLPIVGIASRIIAAAADLAAIGQTVGEAATNPAVFTNTLSLTMTTTVTIRKDPDDFQFPARARQYEVVLTYDQASKVAHRMSGAIAPGRVDDIVVPFNGVPSGGMVTIDVLLTGDDGYLVGRSKDANGTVGPFGPIPATAEQAGEVLIEIKELLIPLTQQTQYEHVLKLEYENGQHTWVETGPPQATRADLCQGQDDRLCDLVGITVQQRTGMAGYGYLAGNQGVMFCNENTTGIMYALQNVFLGQNPDRGLKRAPCGFRQPAGILYDRLGPADGSGRNFFVLPAADGFYLQSIALDLTAQIDVDNPLTWGQFSQPLDGLAVHPMGFVIGVNRTTHKMEILQLPAQAVDRGQAPEAVPFGILKAGLGTRAGLMSAPVAVAVFNGAILVLEDGNQRIQAFDTAANPVAIFQNQTTSIVELEQGSGIVYVDLAVEGLGYMYVLSYVNDGMQVGDYRLDVHTPQGNRLTRTTGVAAARLAVDTFRNVYTLNYEQIAGAPRVEPSLSQWEPSLPSAT